MVIIILSILLIFRRQLGRQETNVIYAGPGTNKAFNVALRKKGLLTLCLSLL